MSAPGETARAAALDLLRRVLRHRRPLDDAWVATLAPGGRLATASSRDRAFARLLAATCLRRLGQIDDVLAHCLERPLPDRAAWTHDVLRLGAAQLLFLGTEAYAAVDGAVRQAAALPEHRGLVNAVLRRLAREGEAILHQQDAAHLNCPGWLWQDWCTRYGEGATRDIVRACLGEPPLDLSVNIDPQDWAARLNATVLPNGSLRLWAAGAVDQLAGYAEGAWWAQDAAARLPVGLLGFAPGDRVLDLCAAPGGKTAQLCAAGATVTAVDRSPARIARLRSNLARLRMSATLLATDAQRWRPDEAFPFVLLDAPCSATGTLRRHPDVWHLKTPHDVARLAPLQDRLLSAACDMLSPGGMLVYCVCSLQHEEGEARIQQLLAHSSRMQRAPFRGEELRAVPHLVCGESEIRTLPAHWTELGGLDGFFVARLRRTH